MRRYVDPGYVIAVTAFLVTMLGLTFGADMPWALSFFFALIADLGCVGLYVLIWQP